MSAAPLRGYLPVAGYWLLVFIYLVCTQIPSGWFISAASDLILWNFLFLNSPKLIRRLLAVLTAMVYVFYIVALVPVAAFYEATPIVNGAIAFATIFVVLIQSQRLFGFDPQRNAGLRTTCLIVLLVMLAMMLCTSFLIPTVTKWDSPTYDLLLQNLEEKIGVPANAAMGQLFAHYAWLKAWCSVNYYILPALLLLAYYLQLTSGKARMNVLLLACTITLGAAGYFILPAIGPRYFYGELWPEHIPPTLSEWSTLHPNGPATFVRNCMPSLHSAWGMAIVLAGLDLSLGWALFCGLSGGAIILATLGLGEHYVMDLIVAFPFTIAMWILCRTDITRRARRHGFCQCFVIFALWFWGLATHWLGSQPPTLIWAAIGITLLWPCWLGYRMRCPAII